MTLDTTAPTELNTRQLIAQAAIKLFSENGYAGTSIRDIVEAAGVTKPVLYYYFNSKEELYRSLFHDIYDAWLPILRERINAPTDFHTRLRDLMDYYLDFGDESEICALRLIYTAAFGPKAQRELVDIVALEKKHLDLLKQFFQEGIHTGCIRSIPAENAAVHFLGVLTMQLNLRVVTGQEISNEQKETIINYCLSGIGQ
ncbi:MAG: TetR/AcrR family transcriptional regulator [Candidatus Hinthialibacter antarcticus]|nr:TetR/AcrR family transcriptional regulator [Candidatus Hinthialibacter antarcticus]